MIPSRQAAGIAVASLVAVAYGISLVVARMSYDHGAGAVTIAVLRYGILCLVVAVWLHLFGGGISISRRLGWRTMGIGVLAVITAMSYLGTIKLIPVSLATWCFTPIRFSRSFWLRCWWENVRPGWRLPQPQLRLPDWWQC